MVFNSSLSFLQGNYSHFKTCMLQRFKHCISYGFIDSRCKDFSGALSSVGHLLRSEYSLVNLETWDWNPGSRNLSSAAEEISRNGKAEQVPPPLERNAISRNELRLSSSLW